MYCEFRVPIEKIYFKQTITETSPNGFGSGGSKTGDLYAPAMQVYKAYFSRTQLTAQGFARLKRDEDFDIKTKTGAPFDYFTYGAACTEVEVNILTGEHQVLQTYIVFDVGKSLNTAIDIGQIEGGFVQGVGEPPLLLSIYVMKAIKHAVRAARAQHGLHVYVRLDSPATVQRIQAACRTGK